VWGQNHYGWFVASANQLIVCGEAISDVAFFSQTRYLHFENAVTACFAVSCIDRFNHQPCHFVDVTN